MRKLKVLVVDDDRDFAESLAELLEIQGHDVALAFNGEQAVQISGKRNFDITFMDIKMPGMDGIETFLKLLEIKPRIRVAMMTGFTVERLLDQARAQGAMGILHKPIDMNQLFALLQEVDPDGVVLVADDDPSFVCSMQELLEDNGYRVVTASNGKAAIERVLAEVIDVLLLDLRLPDLSGLEVYQTLKERDHLPRVIIVTAYPLEEDSQLQALKSMLGSNYLIKPFDPERLLQAIEAI